MRISLTMRTTFNTAFLCKHNFLFCFKAKWWKKILAAMQSYHNRYYICDHLLQHKYFVVFILQSQDFVYGNFCVVISPHITQRMTCFKKKVLLLGPQRQLCKWDTRKSRLIFMQMNYSKSKVQRKYESNCSLLLWIQFDYLNQLDIERKVFSILKAEDDPDPNKSINGDRSRMIRANSNQRSARLEK